MADLPPGWLLAAVVVVGVVGPGLSHYWLTGAGYGLAGNVAWVGGYAGTVLAVWYGWLRPLDIRGPSG